MTKFLHVFWNEYTRHVLRKRFLFALFSVPFFIVFLGLVSILTVVLSTDTSPIGYVDHSGLLVSPRRVTSSTDIIIKPVTLISYLPAGKEIT